MSIREAVYEALDNSVENTSLAEVIAKPAEEIAGELQDWTTGFETTSESELVEYIIAWKLIKGY